MNAYKGEEEKRLNEWKYHTNCVGGGGKIYVHVSKAASVCVCVMFMAGRVLENLVSFVRCLPEVV